MADQAPETIELKPVKQLGEEAIGEAVGLPGANSLNLMLKVAEQVAGSALFPKAIAQNKNNMMAVMLRGRELGLQPMESLQSMYIVHDKIGMAAETMRQLMQREGIRLEWIKDDDEGATVKGTNPQTGYEYTSTFTKKDAQRANLDKGDNYQKYPRNMYRSRATSNLYRMMAKSSVGIYTVEELEDPSYLPQQGDAEKHAELRAQKIREAKTELANKEKQQPGERQPEAAEQEATVPETITADDFESEDRILIGRWLESVHSCRNTEAKQKFLAKWEDTRDALLEAAKQWEADQKQPKGQQGMGW